MRRPRYFLNSILGVVIAAGACSNEQVAPSQPLFDKTAKAPKLATCDPLKPVIASAVFGPEGGTLKIGPHRLVIPPGSLTESVTITGSISATAVNSIQFGPAGLQFTGGAILTMSFENCKAMDLPNTVIVYTDDNLNILEMIPALAVTKSAVTGVLWHFSQYAVAY